MYSNSKQRLFSFQKMNKYFLMPFSVPIICFTTKFFSETMKTDGGKINIRDVSEDNTHTFVFLYQIIQSICLILGGLFHFIQINTIKTKTKIKNSKENKEGKNTEEKNNVNQSKINKIPDFSINNDDDNEYLEIKSITRNQTGFTIIEKPKKNYDKIKKVLIIIFIPLFFILYNLGIAYGVKHPQLEKRIYFLFFFTLINYVLFKKRIYRHQKLSLLIALIGIIPFYIAFGLYLDLDEYNYFYDLFLLIGSFGYSVFLVSIKYLTHNKGISVFLLLLYQGALSFIYTLIIYIGISLYFKGDFTYITNIFHCDANNYICLKHYYFKIIMYLILNTILQILIFFVVYIFSPEIFAISDIFSPLFSFIALCIETKETKVLKIILTILGYLIIAIGAFIYNEIIVCNFCKLNENTWKAIDQKAKDEFYESEKYNDLILNDELEKNDNKVIYYQMNDNLNISHDSTN